MAPRTPLGLPPTPPAHIKEEIRKRLSGKDLEAAEATFALRATAQQVDNTLTEWLADIGGSAARWQILMLLWAARERGVPHTEIVDALSVTRATVSGLMAGLERDGLVRSTTDPDDRRKLLARLTAKGGTIVSRGIEANIARLRTAFRSLSSAELARFTALLNQVREGFAATVHPGKKP